MANERIDGRCPKCGGMVVAGKCIHNPMAEFIDTGCGYTGNGEPPITNRKEENVQRPNS